MLTRVLAGKIAAKNAVNLTYQVAVKNFPLDLF